MLETQKAEWVQLFEENPDLPYTVTLPEYTYKKFEEIFRECGSQEWFQVLISKHNPWIEGYPLAHLRSSEDYQLAYQTRGEILFGSGRPGSLIANYRSGIEHDGPESPHYGCILCPEQRGEVWTIVANNAFFLGGIEAGRQFRLING